MWAGIAAYWFGRRPILDREIVYAHFAYGKTVYKVRPGMARRFACYIRDQSSEEVSVDELVSFIECPGDDAGFWRAAQAVIVRSTTYRGFNMVIEEENLEHATISAQLGTARICCVVFSEQN